MGRIREFRQFYLRGRCKREKCDFKHPPEFASRQQAFSWVKPRLKRKVRDLDSDQEIFDSSDDDDDLKDRLKLREERKEKAKFRSSGSRNLEERPGSLILEKDKFVIRQELKKVLSSQPKISSAKTRSMKWTGAVEKCVKCGQTVPKSERRKSI